MTEQYFTLAQATKVMPCINGRRLHVSTVFRWCKKGCKGVFLKYAKIGRTIVVTEAELNSFFIALAAVDNLTQPSSSICRKRKPPQISSAARQKSLDEAQAVLVRAGIIRPKDATQPLLNQNTRVQ